ncbi:hypothetical protein Tco_0800174 [Tanacetum coccineum]|uniref:Xylulose kinase-1 n=1 Tax=Tanacetum coccineum TaxID=301880 RepID=A0ABQ4ZUR4_9ASTR
MANLKFADTHNMVAFLSKPEESDGFEQIVDFLNAHPIKYALTVNPTIYISCIEQFWSTVKAKTINGEVQLHALVDGKKIIITESTVRRDLQLEDAEGVDYEAIHKELGDSLVRAATTASSLEAEQDSGNITKTRSKATPNESSSLGTTSGGGPRCQETIGDTIAQTRFENVSKHCNDLLLARGNTLRSDEDRLKLDDMMALCTTLQNMVLDLEKTKTTQHNEIASLKRRVKKLEKKDKSRTHKLKRLYKVGLTARVESSRDEESLGEDASKQGRINVIDADEEITLVSIQDDANKEMFDVDALNGEEVFVAGKNKNIVEEVVDAAQVSKSTTTTTISSQQSQDKGKGIMIEEPVKPMKNKDQISFDEEVALKLQIDDDYQLAERLQAQEQEELSIEEKTTLFQQLLEKKEESILQEDLEDLYKLVKAKFESTKPVEDLDLLLWGDLKTMFEPHVEDAVWRNQQAYKVLDWKLYDSCGVHSLGCIICRFTCW